MRLRQDGVETLFGEPADDAAVHHRRRRGRTKAEAVDRFERDLAVGAGIAQCDAQLGLRARNECIAAGRLVRVLPKHAMKGGGLYLVWPSRRLMPARVALVRDYLTEELGKLVGA